MKTVENISITGGGNSRTLAVTYADGDKEKLECSEPVAAVIANLATALRDARTVKTATGDRAYRTRDSEVISRGATTATSTAPTAPDAEFMRLVRAVAPKYDNAFKDSDPRLVALDVLRLAPAEAFSAVWQSPMSQIPLDQAIDVLAQVGDYMKANNISPKAISTGDSIRQINADSAKFWGKKPTKE